MMGSEEISIKAEELLLLVNNELDITYPDPEGNRKRIGSIKRGIRRLLDIAGGALSFEEESAEMALLLAYCRYDRVGALEHFSANYQDELLDLRISREVKDYVAEDGDQDTELPGRAGRDL